MPDVLCYHPEARGSLGSCERCGLERWHAIVLVRLALKYNILRCGMQLRQQCARVRRSVSLLWHNDELLFSIQTTRAPHFVSLRELVKSASCGRIAKSEVLARNLIFYETWLLRCGADGHWVDASD